MQWRILERKRTVEPFDFFDTVAAQSFERQRIDILLERNEILHDCNLHGELEHHSVLPVVTFCDDAFQRRDHYVGKVLSGVLCGEISGVEANGFFYEFRFASAIVIFIQAIH